jgi:hypothetical protein
MAVELGVVVVGLAIVESVGIVVVGRHPGFVDHTSCLVAIVGLGEVLVAQLGEFVFVGIHCIGVALVVGQVGQAGLVVVGNCRIVAVLVSMVG